MNAEQRQTAADLSTNQAVGLEPLARL